MSQLLFTIGAARSGKSTFAKRWVREGDMRVIVSADAIRLALHGQRYEFLAETFVFAIKHVMIRALLKQGFDVLVDGTNTSEVSIQRILEIDPNAEPIIFNTAEDVCIQRAIDTQQEDLIPVIKNHCKNIQTIVDVGYPVIKDKIVNLIKNRNSR